MKVIALLSGGLDSTTLCWHLVAAGHDVSAISFDYGQRHIRELKAAELLAKVLGIQHGVIDLPRIFSGSLVGDGELPEGEYTDDSMRATVVFPVPGLPRNTRC